RDRVQQLVTRCRRRLRRHDQRRPLDLRQQRQRKLQQRERAQRGESDGGNDDRHRPPKDRFDQALTRPFGSCSSAPRERGREASFTSAATASSVSASAPPTTTRSPSCNPEVISTRPFAWPPVATATRLTRKRLNDPSAFAAMNSAGPSAPATMASSGTVSTAPR